MRQKGVGSWEVLLNEPRPNAFVVLILICLLLELVGYLFFWSMVVFIPFFYVIVVVSGIWYGRRSLWLAGSVAGLTVVITFLHLGRITPDSFLNAGMLCCISVITGTIAEQKDAISREIRLCNDNFQKLDEEKKVIQSELNVTRITCDAAGRKSRFLSGITHNDIFNNLSALIGSVDLLKTKISDPELRSECDRSENIMYTMRRQIEFARIYERIGTSKPQWLNVDTQVRALLSSLPQNQMTYSISLEGLEIFVDPLFEQVFANLIDNSFIHGVRVSHISVSFLPFNRDIAIVYEDDGIGVHAGDKSQIFEKGVGKKPGFGLFLSREILANTGLTIKECGVYGKGARFEIFVPEGKFRFS
jgi:signal transduction histidine kinase